MKYINLTKEDKSFICNPNITAKEIVKKFKIGSITVSRWRKKLGANIPTGSKPGRARPWQISRETRKCIVCDKSFEVKPSIGQKICSLKCKYKFMSNIDRSYMQTEEYRNKLKKDTTPEYKRYCNRVHKLSQKTYEQNMDIINPNKYKRTLCGVDGGYQLDHIISIKEGFEKGISPEEMSLPKNLRMLPWRTNLMRQKA